MQTLENTGLDQQDKNAAVPSPTKVVKRQPVSRPTKDLYEMVQFYLEDSLAFRERLDSRDNPIQTRREIINVFKNSVKVAEALHREGKKPLKLEVLKMAVKLMGAHGNTPNAKSALAPPSTSVPQPEPQPMPHEDEGIEPSAANAKRGIDDGETPPKVPANIGCQLVQAYTR